MSAAEWERIREANRIRQERELSEREVAAAELLENATPETLRHRDARVIDMMLRRDTLTPEQYRAGLEISQVWVGITSDLFAKVQRYERQAQGGSHADWRASMTTAYLQRYIPWRDEAGKIPVKRGTLADLVFLVTVDNYGCQQIASSWHIHRDKVKLLVRQSLQRYAEIGGWVDHCGRSQNAA